MIKLQNSNRGFSVVEGLLTFVIIAMIGFIGWYVYQAKNKADKSLNTASATVTSATTKKTSTTKSLVPYAGWKQYCSTQEKACFKYPGTWAAKNIGASDPSGDGIQLTSPAGTVLEFQSNVSGLGGACDAKTAPHIYIHKVIIEPTVANLYIVETGGQNTTDHIGLVNGVNNQAPKTGDTGNCMYYTLFKAKHTSTIPTGDDAWFVNNGGSLKTADLSSAELILKSYYYQT